LLTGVCGLNNAKQLAAQSLKVVRIAQGGAPEGLVVPLVAGGPHSKETYYSVKRDLHSRVSQGRSVLVGWDGGTQEGREGEGGREREGEGTAERIVPYLTLADAQCEVQMWSDEEEEGLAGPTLYVNGSLRVGGAKVPALASIPLHDDLARQGLLQVTVSCVCVCVCVCVYICIYIYVYTHTHTHTHIHTYINTYILYTHTYTNTHIYMYTYIHVYMHTNIYDEQAALAPRPHSRGASHCAATC